MKSDYIKELNFNFYETYKKRKFTKTEEELLDNLIFIKQSNFTEEDYNYIKSIKKEKTLFEIMDLSDKFSSARETLEKNFDIDLELAYKISLLNLSKESKKSFIKFKIMWFFSNLNPTT